MKLLRYTICALAAATYGCSSDAPDVELTVTADKTDVAVGEPVTLAITHNVQGLCVYNGESGHDYYKSAAYLLKDATEEQLKTQIFREPDPDVTIMEYDFSGDTPGSLTVGGGQVDVINVSSGESLLGSEANIVANTKGGGNCLQITSTHPEWWYQALRINLNTKLGSNQNLTLTMHFDKDVLQDVYTAEEHPEVADFCVVVRIAGKGLGSDEIVFHDNTVWDIYWAPSLDPKQYSVDLSRVVAQWQSGTGLEMETLSYVQILFTTSGSVGYVGNFYIDKIEYGDYDYVAFDTAEGITLGSGPGTVYYTHAFSEPGTYRMVVLGTNTSWKNYSSDGYSSSYADVGADEYRYKREMRQVTINVK